MPKYKFRLLSGLEVQTTSTVKLHNGSSPEFMFSINVNNGALRWSGHILASLPADTTFYVHVRNITNVYLFDEDEPSHWQELWAQPEGDPSVWVPASYARFAKLFRPQTATEAAQLSSESTSAPSFTQMVQEQMEREIRWTLHGGERPR